MRKNKQSLDMLKERGVQILSEISQVKSLSLWVKGDVLSFFILYIMWVWMCYVVERVMKGVHSEFYYEY